MIINIFLAAVPILDLIIKIGSLFDNSPSKRTPKVVNFGIILIIITFNFFLIKCGLTSGVFWNILICCFYISAFAVYDDLTEEAKHSKNNREERFVAIFVSILIVICLQWAGGYYTIFFR